MAGFAVPADHATLQDALDEHDTDGGSVTITMAAGVHAGATLNNGACTTTFTIDAASGAECNGKSRDVSGTGAHISATVNSGAVVWINNSNGNNFGILDISIENTGTADCIQVNESGGITLTLARLVLHGADTNGVEIVSAVVAAVSNIIVYDVGGNGLDFRSSSTGNIFYCTVMDGAFGIMGAAGVTAQNCVSMNHSSWDYYGTGPGSGFTVTTCIAEDTSGSIDSAEWLETGETPTKDYVAFVDKNTANSEDFHLWDLEHGTYNNVALAAADVISITVDCDGASRDGTTPDIGADEYVAPAAGGGLTAGTLALMGVGK